MPELTVPVKVAIVGYGPAFNMGHAHAQAINDLDEFQVIGVCDINKERLEAARSDLGQIRTYSKVEEVAADHDVQLAVVVTPHNVHAQNAITCLEAGKHVVVEKPMALTIRECTRMIEAAKKASVTLSVFHNRRGDGDFLAIKDIIEKGYVGEVFHLEADSSGYTRPHTWWRSDKAISGGLFYDWGAHFVDWILHLIPAPLRTVSGQFQERVWGHVTNEDHVEAYIRFANSAVAHVQISTIAAAGKARWYILGTKGAIVDHGAGSFKVYTSLDGHIASFEVPYYKKRTQDFAGAYYRKLADHLVRNEPVPVTPESARRVIAVMELAEKSSQTGEELEVPYE